MYILSWLISLYTAISITSANSQFDDNYLLLIISLDGFRYDYLKRYSNPNGFLDKFSQQGVKSVWSEPIFPSNTYPVHWSIATGMWAESHGVTNNHVYDPITKERYSMGRTKEDTIGWFQQIEPVWIENEKVNGKKYNKHSVVFDWPGSSAPFANLQPMVYRQIEKENCLLERFNNTVDKFVESIVPNKTNLAFLYFNEPDHTGHAFGPDSKEVAKVVQELDYVLAYLFNSLIKHKGYNIDKDIDTIILTDHGMANIDENRKTQKNHFYLSDYIDLNKYLLVDKINYGSVAELWFKNETNDLNFVYERLVEAIKSKESKKIKGIYLRKDIPERYHFKSHYRIAPLIMVATEGYQIIPDRNKTNTYSQGVAVGNHGFDPNEEAMKGIFLAKGKSFKTYYNSKKPVYLIDVYTLLCKLLQLSPHDNNGTLSRIEHLLVKRNSKYFNYDINFYRISTNRFLLASVGVVIIILIVSLMKLRCSRCLNNASSMLKIRFVNPRYKLIR